MMDNDRFVVAYTSSTLIIGDTVSGKASEIDWISGGHEKLVSFLSCLVAGQVGMNWSFS